ncbi:MAG: Fic family protein [Bacteroidales bacterium]|nr:Fic family protein [Bacteroidales bacterium]MBN2819873.1 Fic family protein [Bacteroidales bacterium]
MFYFASLIHLRFAHIHLFRDDNGRAARLIEKWFVAEILRDVSAFCKCTQIV